MIKRDYYLETILEDGTKLPIVVRRTEKGVSNFANRMFRKYGDGVTVEVDYFDDNMDLVRYTTFHA